MLPYLLLRTRLPKPLSIGLLLCIEVDAVCWIPRVWNVDLLLHDLLGSLSRKLDSLSSFAQS